MQVVTRFAPSPTGYLHIGSARTALFSYLFAKHHHGKFLLRIEDTDRARSTQPAVDALISGLKWLGINWDEEEIYQFSRSKRHAEIANELVQRGKAYYCYLSEGEIEALRSESLNSGKPMRSIWRDKTSDEAPIDIKPVVRLKAPRSGQTKVNDLVQGLVTVENDTIDDLVLLRSDGAPTYMLAVVVDDHDMGITHVIRGDDHLSNTPKQILIYQGMDWKLPEFAHISLIHGEDGAKLSKRHGALGVEAYKDMGYLPQSLCNYLLRLGWSHGNDEFISMEQAIEWFNLESIGRSPARLDFKKLDSLNARYIKEMDEQKLLELVLDGCECAKNVGERSMQNIQKSIRLLKDRAKTLNDIRKSVHIFIENRDVEFGEEGLEVAVVRRVRYKQIKPFLSEFNGEWKKGELFAACKKFAAENGLEIHLIGELLRIAITGLIESPSIFEIMEIIGKEEVMRRIDLTMKAVY